jgi:hypothetical protein
MNAPRVDMKLYVYRGFSSSYETLMEPFSLFAEVGHVMISHSFASTSSDVSVARTFSKILLFIIELPPNAAFLRVFGAGNNNEKEILLPGRSVMVVQDILPSRYSILRNFSNVMVLKWIGIAAPFQQPATSDEIAYEELAVDELPPTNLVWNV